MNAQVISFKCVLKSKTGQVISSSFNRDVITAPQAESDFLIGLVRGLEGVQEGEKRMIQLSAEEAYGFYDPNKVKLYPNHFERPLKIGDFVALQSKSGETENYKVSGFKEDMLVLDGNHPLAGQDLIFEIETIAVREAKPEELEIPDTRLTGVKPGAFVH